MTKSTICCVEKEIRKHRLKINKREKKFECCCIMFSVIEKVCRPPGPQNAFVYAYTKNCHDLLKEPIMCFDDETSDNDRMIVLEI